MPLPVRGKRFCRGIVLAVVSALAFAAALLFVFAYPLPSVHDDAVGYLSSARHVAAGHGFTQDGVTPAVYRPPLFPVLLGGWFFLTGTSSPLSAAVPDRIRWLVSGRRPGGKRG